MFHRTQSRTYVGRMTRAWLPTISAHAGSLVRTVDVPPPCALPQLRSGITMGSSTSLQNITSCPYVNYRSFEGLAKIMSLFFITRLSVSTILVFSCTALQILEEGQSRNLEERALQILPSSAHGLAMVSPANLSTDSDDRDDSLDVRCLDYGLMVESCDNVLAIIPTSDRMETWGYPDELPPGTAVDEDLPLKYWSGKETGITLMVLLARGIPSVLT